MTGWPILSVVTFLPLLGVLFILAMRGDDEQSFREACIASLVQAEALDFMIDTVKSIALDLGRQAQ